MTKCIRTATRICAVALLGALASMSSLQTPTGRLYSPAVANEVAPVRVAIQMSENDPKAMHLALNNAANLSAHYKQQGRKVDIHVVTYGPGLHMLRADTSPVKQRVATMSLEIEGLTFAACANTRANMSKQEGAEIALLSEARVVPSGVVTLAELQQKGFAYIRP
ncbi:MAG: DsrE family protein [Hyphomicrobiaceae bacterium]